MDDIEKLKTLLRNNIREQRKILNMSQLKLSNEAGLALSYTADIENGNKTPSLKSLCKIAKALRVQPHQLMMDSKDRNDFDKYSKVIELFSELKLKMNEEFNQVLREISAVIHERE